jgi:hypothetical protein
VVGWGRSRRIAFPAMLIIQMTVVVGGQSCNAPVARTGALR